MSGLSSKSAEDISNIIRRLGDDYEEYGDLFEESDIDGSTIDALDIDEISNFVKDMNITNTVHKAKIKGTIKKLIEENRNNTKADGININIANTNNNNVSDNQFVKRYEVSFQWSSKPGERGKSFDCLFTGTLNKNGTLCNGKLDFPKETNDNNPIYYIGNFHDDKFHGEGKTFTSLPLSLLLLILV